MPEVNRPRPGRMSLIAMAAASHAFTHAATPVQLFGRDEPQCQICGQRGHCSADCRRGMTCTTREYGAQFVGHKLCSIRMLVP